MSRDVLDVASKMLSRRDFPSAIKLLEGRSEIYEGNFDYYILLAHACLYAGDAGTASMYYQKAREIKLTDTGLLLGQAALFLRRGNTDRAVQYYLEVLDGDPENKTAKRSLEFIRTQGDYDTICRWIDNGKIERFYPPLGVNIGKILGIAVPAAACVLGALFMLLIIRFPRNAPEGERADLSALALSSDETKFAQEKDMASSAYAFILSNKEITESYARSQRYFQAYRDNAAQIEINRILHSNASLSIKQKARVLMSYLSPPTFDTIADNPSYEDAVKNPVLYEDCYAVWSGRVSNAVTQGNSYSFDLLVGYETMEKVVGIVPVQFQSDPGITSSLPVKVLGKIVFENGKMNLEGRSVYQSVKDFLETP